MLAYWNGQGALDGPFAVYPAREYSSGNIVEVCPFSYSVCLPFVGKLAYAAGVVGLSLLGSPAAIFRPVVPFVVDAVKGVFAGRTRPHIGDEVGERGLPAATHGYPASPVIAVRGVIGVGAPLAHVDPRLVFGWLTQTMGSVSCDQHFVVEASARCGYPPSKAVTECALSTPAITNTVPRSLLAYMRGLGYNGETAKTTASKIDELRHNILREMLVRVKKWAAGGSEIRFSTDQNLAAGVL